MTSPSSLKMNVLEVCWVLFVITRLSSTIVATHWIIVKVKVEKVKTNVFEVWWVLFVTYNCLLKNNPDIQQLMSTLKDFKLFWIQLLKIECCLFWSSFKIFCNRHTRWKDTMNLRFTCWGVWSTGELSWNSSPILKLILFVFRETFVELLCWHSCNIFI